ncbi:MAG: deoxyribonuclease IV [Armatimonadota bacterium]
MSSVTVPRPDPARRFGAHMPIAGGLQNALTSGKEVGCDLVQIFTKTPQQWKAKELTDEQVEAFLRAQEETGVPCVASHDSYLINPCSADPELLQKSRQALVDEVVRCHRLQVPLIVMHCGMPGDCPEDEGNTRLADTVKYILDQTADLSPILLLETMAGQGRCVGHRFEHLGQVLQQAGGGDRLQVCVDTCHIFAAGYELRTEEGYAETMRQLDAAVGLDRVRLIHANDSKKELGSRVDRHEHIGDGCIGPEAFHYLLTDERLATVPVILETPKVDNSDPRNLAALRRAAGVPSGES